VAVLKNNNSKQILLSDLIIADKFWDRAIGLMGRRSLTDQQGLWIHSCNSIHTCFMKFDIDCVFLDKNLKIKAIKKQIKPFGLVWPVWGANSVIEVSSGNPNLISLSVGDQLYVEN
jgi:uncharacterized membrane protein (UPF0127 family)